MAHRDRIDDEKGLWLARKTVLDLVELVQQTILQTEGVGSEKGVVGKVHKHDASIQVFIRELVLVVLCRITKFQVELDRLEDLIRSKMALEGATVLGLQHVKNDIESGLNHALDNLVVLMSQLGKPEDSWGKLMGMLPQFSGEGKRVESIVTQFGVGVQLTQEERVQVLQNVMARLPQLQGQKAEVESEKPKQDGTSEQGQSGD